MNIYYYKVYHRDMNVAKTLKLIQALAWNDLNIKKFDPDYIYIWSLEENDSLFLSRM